MVVPRRADIPRGSPQRGKAEGKAAVIIDLDETAQFPRPRSRGSNRACS